MVFGSGAAILTHCEANVRFREGTSITKALTSDTDGGTSLAESACKHVFELWGSSVDEKDILLNVFAEALSALFVDEDVGLASAFFSVFSFLHKWTELIEEIIRRDSLLVFFFFNKSNLNSSIQNRGLVVTRDKSNIGSSFDKLLNGFSNSFAKRIR